MDDVSNVLGIMSDEPSGSRAVVSERGVQLCSSDVFISSERFSEAASSNNSSSGGIQTQNDKIADEQC